MFKNQHILRKFTGLLKLTSWQPRGLSEKGYTLSMRCQFQKIPSLPSGGDDHKSPFQEDIPITTK